MPLSDAFRYPGRYGYGSGNDGMARELFRPAMLPPTQEISKRDNLQLILGSLSAAFGNLDRPGRLGQALAQAGAVYQQQKAATLANAFKHSQEDARMARQDELFRQSQEDRQQEIARQSAADEQVKADRKTAETAKENNRQALVQRLIDLGSTAEQAVAYAENPGVAMAAIQEAEMAKREKKTPEPRSFQMGKEGGILVTPDEVGGYSRTVIPGIPGAGGTSSADKITPAAIQALVDKYPQYEAIIRVDPKAFVKQVAEQAFPTGGTTKTGKTGDPEKDLRTQADLMFHDDDWKDQWSKAHGGVMPDYGDAVNEATKHNQIIKSLLNPGPVPGQQPKFDPRGYLGTDSKAVKQRAQDLRGGSETVKPPTGQPVAGMNVASPNKSAPGNTDTKYIQSAPKKSEAQATGEAKLESAVAKARTILPPDAAAQLGPAIKSMTDQGIDPEEIAAYLERQVQTVLGGRH